MLCAIKTIENIESQIKLNKMNPGKVI